MSNDEFNECMAMLFSYYPNRPFCPVIAQLYNRRFIHLSYAAFYKGVNDHIDSKFKWFPDIAELKSFMPETKPLQLEDKGSVTCCENTKRLMQRYPYTKPIRGAA
jgi:hypothetical protein